MSNAASAIRLLELTRRFLGGDVGAASFCNQYMPLWRDDRDARSAQKRMWERPYDEEFTAAWRRGELSGEALEAEMAQLWGYDAGFQAMIDRVHSACSSFRPVPELAWEIGEEQLRPDVQEALAGYESRGSALS